MTGLNNGATYTFKLRAINASGNGAESDEATAIPVAVPAKPAGFSAIPGDGLVLLQWTGADDATITGWQYRYRTEGGYGPWNDIPGSGATTTAHVVTGLDNGASYTFKLRAMNASGNGAESDEATATPIPVPAKPASFTATAGDGQVSLQWTGANDATITGWQYAIRTAGSYGLWTGIPDSGAATTAHTVTGLDNGASYTFKLRAINASGNGAESDEATAIPVAVPAKPAGFTATAGAGQIVLSWNDPNDATITGWQYRYRTEDSYGPWTGIPGSSAATTIHTLTGLDNGATYTFKLRAVNASGNGAESDGAAAIPAAAPARPAGFSATPGDGLVSLQWTGANDATITGWQYTVKTTGGYGPWTGIPGSGPTTTAHTVAGLDNGTAYTFKLRAINASGNGAESDEATATPVAVPAKPAGFTATAGAGQVVLSWNDPNDATIAGWEYNQRRAGGEFKADWTYILGSTDRTTSYTVTGLDNGTAYSFKLRAHNASGSGAESDEATAIPVAAPAKPTGFSATPGDGLVSLQWTDPDDATITGWQYAVQTTGGYGPWTGIPGSGAATTSHTVADLENGTAHTFKLRAINTSGSGAESDEATTIPVAVPAKPAGFSATPGDGLVSLQWTDPDDATITAWQYAVKTTGGYGPWTGIPGDGPTTTAHTVTGLDNGTAYTFKLRAHNNSGNGAESDEATAIPVAVPAKPAGFTTTPGDGQVSLQWTDPNDATITGWQYAIGTAGGYGPWTGIPGSGATTTAHTVTGLENGAPHTFKLRAHNASGNGSESDEVTATPVAVPAKPAGFFAMPGDGQVVLSWNDPNDATIAGWEYNLRRAGGEFEADWTYILGSTDRTTSYTVTGLDNGTAYTFKLRAINASGNGAESDEATATPVAAPAKPAGFSATPGDGLVSLQWTGADDATITGWQYRYKIAGGYGPWTGIPGSGAATTSHIVIGLDNGASYAFKIRAINASGNGVESDEATVTPVAIPAKPAGLTATAGAGQVVLSWSAPNDATITGWQYAVKTTGGYGPWTGILGSGVTTTTHTVDGLNNGASYTFKIRAINASGNGAESDEATAILVAVPTKPAGLTAMAGAGQVALSWNDPNDATITGWQYRYRTEGGYGPWTGIPGGGPTTTAHIVAGLHNGTAYTFKLRAVNASGNGAESDVATATPAAAPAKPAGFSATPGDGLVSLQWIDPNDATITGWQYRYKTENGGYSPWTGIPGSGATTTSHTVTGLDNGTAYTFKVRAINASGNGAESDEATATPVAVPARPAGFTATAGDRQVVLSWNDPNDATITGWQYRYRTEGGYGPWTGIPGSGAATTSHTLTGLDNGTAYTFMLRAVNASGNGAESDEATATPVAVPAKPAGFTAAAGAGQVVLSWNDPNDATIAGWEYNQRRAGGEFEADWTYILGSTDRTTSHTITGLDNDTSYTFKLRAINASGNGAESDEATATPVAVPAKPMGFTATPGDRQVVLSWNDPNDATIAGWEYNLRRAGGEFEADWTYILGSIDRTTSYTVTGLDNGTAYSFKLRAVNASGNGAESDEATASPVAVPAKPTGFSATPGDGQVLLSWNDPNDATITGWQYTVQTTGGYGPWTGIPGSGAATTIHTVTGLDNGTAYTFKLRAVNASGNGTESEKATAIPVAVPAKPAGFTATPGDGQVLLSWNDPNDATITGWQYTVQTKDGYGPWTGIPGSGATMTSHTVTGLENGTAYTFKLRAVNASGNGVESDKAIAIPVAVPAKPAGFSAMPGDGQVSLQWTGADDVTITGWQYRYRTKGGGYGPWTGIPGSGATTTAHTVTGLENGTAYTFKLRAHNASGNGVESDEATAIPVAIPAKPTGFSATPGDGLVSLQWIDPNDATIMGWQYRYKTENGGYGPWTDIPGSGATTTIHIVTGLENGTAYTFKLRAINTSGNGAESDEATAIPVAVPAKPAGFSVTLGDEQVSLQWTNPDDKTITGWQYAVKTTGGYGPWTNIPGSSAATTSHTVTGLDNGAAYTFKIRAINASGNSAESDEAAATPVTVPARPAGFTATAGAGEVLLSWNDPNDATITGWQYAVKTTGGYGPWTGIPGSGAATTSHTVTGLDNGTAYTFKLRAMNASGNGAESEEATAIPVAVPARPTGFSAMPGDGQVSLQWTDPNDATITGWQYRYRTGDGYGLWTDIPGSNATTTAHIVAGLDNGTTYTFKLRAMNASGNGAESDEATAIPVAVPAKPAGFSATPGDGQVSLQWTDPNDGTITGWQYRYKTENGGYGSWISIPGSGATTTSHTVAGLENGTAYTFKLRAVNASGNGAESEEATATPVAVPARPAGFTATAGAGEVVLSWNDPNDATITGWQYTVKTTGGYGPWTGIPGSGPTTTAHTVAGLDNGTAYTFTLRAVNASGNGAESEEVTATLVAVPAKPAGFTATTGAGEVVLSWNDPNDATIAGWEYNQRRAGGEFEVDWTYILGSTDRTTSYTVTGLDNGTAYTFKIRAHNASGTGAESDEATATPAAAPAKPAGFSAIPGDGLVSLQWSAPNDATITGWQYAVKTTGGYGPWTGIPGSSAATTSHTLTGLDNGASYTFKLRAINASGNGAESDEATATPIPAPAKPAGFSATPGDGLVSLQWTDPNDATITGWQYAVKTTGGYGPWTGIPGSSAATTSYTLTGLDNGASYTVKLRAHNASGDGAESDEATATPVAVPAKPAGFTATAGAGEVVLSWNDPNDATITGWQYRYRTEGGYGPWTVIPGSGAATTSHTVTGLDNGASYTFKLRAVNASGNGAESDEATAIPVAVPARPAGFTATAGDRQVVLSWNDPNDATITGWQYRYRAEGGGYGPWTGIPGSDAATMSHTVTGLDNGTAYTFKLRAVNASGNGAESDEATATPVAVPARPAGFTATAGTGEVVLSWNDPSDATITGWQYRYRTEGGYGPWTGIPGSGAATTSHIVAGLDNGTAYTFTLRAVNASGNGAESEEAIATPVAVPAKPAGFTATAGAGQVVLSWNDPNDATIAGWEYNQRRAGGEFEADWTYILGSTDRTTSYTVTGLDNGTAYTFKLRAHNASGTGVESDEATATPAAAPAKPAGFSATPGDGLVSLQWTDPNDATITGWQYAVQTTGGYGSWTGIPGSGATTTAHTVTGLDNGATYTFKLRAVNASGTGAESDEATATPVAVPARPTGFSATSGDRRVSLQWAGAGDATITRWQYAVRTTSTYSPWTGIPGSGATTTAHTVAGLDNGTAYTFKLRAVNTSGNGAESGEATATPAAAPARPTGLTATAGAGQVVLSWNDPNNAAITGWEYNQRRAGDAFEADWTYILGSTDRTTRYTVIGLEIGASYGFRVRAIAGGRAGPASDEATVTLPQVPARPTNFSATPGDRRVSLQWAGADDATITRWQYAVRTTSTYSPWTGIPGSGATTTAHTVAGLDNGTAYTFKLRAINTSGNGAESEEATATPAAVPARPTGLTATAGTGQVVLSWNDPNNAAITGWEYNQRRAGGAFEADWTYILGSTDSTTSYTVIGLEIGASYGFRVRAIAGDLVGPASDEATVTLPQVPARPAGFTATAGDGRVSLQWSDPSDATITGWQYAVRTTGTYSPWTGIPGSDATTTAHTVAGLDNGTAYIFKLRAMNTSGNGMESGEATATPAAAPARPTGLTAKGGAGEVVLSWNDPNDAAITGWEYNQRRAGGEFEADWTYILGSTDSTTSYTVIGLEIGASYGFRIRAIAGDLVGPASDEATVTLPLVPARPAGFTATAGDGRVSLQWNDPNDATITGWQYKVAGTGGYGPWTGIPGSGATTTSHIVAGLDNGTAYSFKLRARNASGNGMESGEATATPGRSSSKAGGLDGDRGRRGSRAVVERPRTTRQSPAGNTTSGAQAGNSRPTGHTSSAALAARHATPSPASKSAPPTASGSAPLPATSRGRHRMKRP